MSAGPAVVVPGRPRPAGGDAHHAGVREAVAIGRRSGRQRLRHEAGLDERGDAGLDIGVEDAVEDGPRMDGPAGGVLRVGVGRAPFQRRRAVAGGEEIVGADIDGAGVERGELAEELPPVRHGRVVRLVIAEPVPDRPMRPEPPRGIDADGDGEGRHRARAAPSCLTSSPSCRRRSASAIGTAARSRAPGAPSRSRSANRSCRRRPCAWPWERPR